MSPLNKVRLAASLFSVAAIIYAWRTRQSHGSFLGVPFEFRVPSVDRVRRRWWNRDDRRLFTPHVFGVGWSVNLLRLGGMLGILEDARNEDEIPPVDPDRLDQ